MSGPTLRFLALAAGFCLMLLQIVSGRSLAPYLGTSVYTWTNVIATTLLGLAVGSVMGGLLADRGLGRKALAWNLVAAGGASVLANYLLVFVDQSFAAAPFHIAWRSAFYCFIVFFPSACLLAAVSPQLVKLEVKDIGEAGAGAGSLGAWNAAGSILGTLSGGYVLISALGTKGLLTGVGLALVVLGLWVGKGHGVWKNRLAFLVGLVFVGDFIAPGHCRMETDYFCIRVQTRNEEGVTRHILRLDHLVHSLVTPEDPSRLGYGYERVYAHLIAARAPADGDFRTFFIGGGGYVLPRYLERYYPRSSVTVAEIDPGVTEANHAFMGLPRDTGIRTVNEDARQHLIRAEEGDYDFVFGDAFNDFSVPYHLTTVEFHERLKTRMARDGVYALNIIDDVRYGQFLASMYRTLSRVWKHVYIAPQTDKLLPGRRTTIVLMASDDPIDFSRWGSVRSFASEDTDFGADGATLAIMREEQVAAFLDRHPAPALTDDFVPVERYLAPVFRDAY